MTCDTLTTVSHETHVMPRNAKAHWRQYTDATLPCGQPATVHVRVEYADGTVVERDMCLACADSWQSKVQALERRSDIPALGIVHEKAKWTITAIEEVV